MSKKNYNKLIRDKIPKIIQDSGKTYQSAAAQTRGIYARDYHGARADSRSYYL